MRAIRYQPVSTLLHPDHAGSQTAIILRCLMNRAFLGLGPARYEDLLEAIWRAGIHPDGYIYKRISDAKLALKAAGIPLHIRKVGRSVIGAKALYWLTPEDVARLTPEVHPAVIWRSMLVAALILFIFGIEMGVIVGQLLEWGGRP